MAVKAKTTRKTTAKPKAEISNVPQPRALNEQMKQFAHEYLKDMNATKAATRAGYSEKTARAQGSRLLGYHLVQELLQELFAEQRNKIKMDSEQLIQQLTDENFADIADLYDEDDNIKPVRQWPLIWRISGMASAIKSQVEIEYDDDGNKKTESYVIEFKVANKIKQKELIGKHLGAFVERVEIDASDPVKDIWAQISGKSLQPKEG